MAPTSSTSSAGGTSTALPLNTQPTLSSGFAGEEFSNNLFSDLAPLLTLFGEQVTKQFLSMSLGWADNILLAVGPLGVITAVVSAIRVGGVRILKALIGRARENQTTAELELLSSTSNDVSELWNGREIVRQIGRVPTLELVVYREKAKKHSSQNEQGVGLREDEREEASDTEDEIQIGDLREAWERNWLEQVRERGAGRLTTHDLLTLSRQPPNITLNVDKASPNHREVWIFAILGMALQAVALLISAIMTYYWKEKKGASTVRSYAYPLFLLGSCALIIGMALCSHIIDDTTEEQVFRPSEPKAVKSIFRLQMACTMGDQHYEPFLILNSDNNEIIRTSRTLWEGNTRLLKTKTILAVSFSLSGFICQFVGLRALHWSATIIQLGVIAIMTGVRSYVRRGLSYKPKAVRLLNSDPDWLALFIGTACLHEWPYDGEEWLIRRCPSLEICTGGYGFITHKDELNAPLFRNAMLNWVKTGSPPFVGTTFQGPETIFWLTAADDLHVRPWTLWDSTRVQKHRVPRSMTIADPRIALRDKLQPSSTIEDPGLVQLAKNLASAIKRTINLMEHYKNRGYLDAESAESNIGFTRFSWTHLVDNRRADLNGHYSQLQHLLVFVIGTKYHAIFHSSPLDIQPPAARQFDSTLS